MSEYTLTAQPALGGYQETFEGVSLEEQTGLAIVSIATPIGGEDALVKALKDGYGAALPKTGEVSLSKDGQTRFLGMARDQMFAIFDHTEPDAVDIVGGKLKDVAYLNSQSDNWVGLRLSGSKSRDVLERICPLDLEPSRFAEGKVARTSMEHMGVIILPDGADSFLLITASSSAASFLHAVETSIQNVVG